MKEECSKGNAHLSSECLLKNISLFFQSFGFLGADKRRMRNMISPICHSRLYTYVIVVLFSLFHHVAIFFVFWNKHCSKSSSCLKQKMFQILFGTNIAQNLVYVVVWNKHCSKSCIFGTKLDLKFAPNDLDFRAKFENPFFPLSNSFIWFHAIIV